MDCCLCGGSIDVQHFPNGNIWFHGNSAQPVMEGRCCTSCTENIVVGERYKAFDIGYVVYKGEQVPADALECKRQAMASEGQECFEEDE
jgi:hypothetical protein